MLSCVSNHTFSALGHDDERGPRIMPRGENLVLTATWLQPLDVLIAGFHDVRQGDELLDSSADVLRLPHDRGPDVGVVTDAGPRSSLLGHNLNDPSTARLEGGTDGAAAIELKNLLDNELTQALDNALIFGDEGAVNAWKQAVSNYAEFKNLWQSKGGLLNTLTERATKDGEKMALKVTPEQASNTIFGVSSNRLSTNPKIASNIMTMKKMLPREEWNLIRQEAFLRITRAGDSQQGGRDVFSGVNFRKEWTKLLKDNPAVIKALFTPEERKLITQFANVAARTTGGAVNASNSANSAFNLLGRLAGALGATRGGKFMMELPILNVGQRGYGIARTSDAISGGGTTKRQGSGAGAGSTLANEEELQNYLATEYGAAKNLLKLGPQ